MALPTTRQQFIAYCKRNLGEPVIEVNVSEQQCEDRVDEALEKFYERHYDACEERYLGYCVTETDVRRGYIQLTEDFEGVMEVRSTSNGTVTFSDSGLFDVNYQFHMEEIFGPASSFRTGAISFYYVNMSYLSLVNWVFNVQPQFYFSRVARRLRINNLNRSLRSGEVLVIRAYIRLFGEEQDFPLHDSNSLDPDDSNYVEIDNIHENVWKDAWLRKYATALIKRQWGENLKKFGAIQLLGGVTLNGSDIYNEAVEEIRNLEEDLQNSYEFPGGFIMA